MLALIVPDTQGEVFLHAAPSMSFAFLSAHGLDIDYTAISGSILLQYMMLDESKETYPHPSGIPGLYCTVTQSSGNLVLIIQYAAH